MPLDFIKILQAVQTLGASLPDREKELAVRRERALAWLDQYADQNETLRRKVEQLAESAPNLRCALPLAERLDAHHPVPPLPADGLTLIAVDGSQIYPDRHAAIPFGLINIGGIVMHTHSAAAPETPLESELLFDESLYHEGALPSEGQLSLRRDLREREFLLPLVQAQSGLCAALSDGPLELWGGKDPQAAAEFGSALSAYQRVLSQLRDARAILAGYVDKPGANLVVRLLEIAHFHDENPDALRDYHPLAGVSDRWLFGQPGQPLLQAGERSAIFTLQSKSAAQYQGDLSLHFFYLNVGDETHPWPVRVEIPHWVADDGQLVDALHAALISQTRILGARPYPYVLHRAHEIALVTHEEKRQVEQLLGNELRRIGAEIDQKSYKQTGKDSSAKSTRRQYP